MTRIRTSAFFISVLLVLLYYVPMSSATTSIATFTDLACKDSLNSLDGPNGYPNGTCKPLNSLGTIGSFQVVGEDPGCGVTIYANDTSGDPCSPTVLELAKITKCYNTSWVYYSIDDCTPPTSTATATSRPQDLAAIIGGVVGGVFLLSITIGICIFFARRRRHRSTRKIEQSHTTEVQCVDPLYELHGQEMYHELPDEQHISELSPQCHYSNGAIKIHIIPESPPAELQGDDGWYPRAGVKGSGSRTLQKTPP